jgi:ABC-type branched-subunit amino acid transport system ATPase component
VAPESGQQAKLQIRGLNAHYGASHVLFDVSLEVRAGAKVQRVAPTKTGSTYRGTVTPFLTGMEHPLAVAFAPDRSLLVGDWATGTIYRIVPGSR